MPVAQFNNPGAIGIIKDTPARELPPDAWSDGQNVRFRENKAEKCLGTQLSLTVSLSASVSSPFWAMPAQTTTTYWWIYGTDETLELTDLQAQHANINPTGVVFSADADIGWTGGLIAGVPVMANGVDSPLMYLVPGTGNDTEYLTYNTAMTWLSVSNTTQNTMRSLRPYGQFLVALDYTHLGTRFPQGVWWSTQADVGAVPRTWDPADTSENAGQTELAAGQGDFCIDGLRLKDSFIIYKERSTHAMRFIGGPSVMRFDELFSDIGLLGRNCAAVFEDKHVILSQGDVYVHDGVRAESLLNTKLRRAVFTAIDQTNYARSFVFPNHQRGEIWICYPESGLDYCSKALIWNYRENTFGFRDLPTNSLFIGYGIVDLGTTDFLPRHYRDLGSAVGCLGPAVLQPDYLSQPAGCL